MERRPVDQMLIRLDSKDWQPAWLEFLEGYSPLVLQVVHHIETDDDRAEQCFLFVCERLSANDCRRLRRFSPTGPAEFSTWLRVVVRNLCLDWRRGRYGRPRVFRTVARLGLLDQQVFDCVYERGMSVGATLLLLQGSHAGLNEEGLSDCLKRIRDSLSSRQLWLLASRRKKFQSLERDPAMRGGSAVTEIADPAPSPEALAELAEQRSVLTRALSRLERSDRLLLQLRYEEGLTLEQVSRLAGLGNAQRADRRIREILQRLREGMSQAENRSCCP